jgi:hypothetical protein
LITDLVGVLRRIDERLRALNLSDRAAEKLANAGGAITNIRKAVRQGRHKGVTTTTLSKLARALQVNEAWLLTGEGPMAENGAHIADQAGQLPHDDAVSLLTAVFRVLEDADEAEARATARIALKAYYTHRSPSGELLSADQRRLLVDTVIRSIRRQSH